MNQIDLVANEFDHLTLELDVLSDIKAACDKLAVGEVVMDSDFTLFQALAAVELMDPRMDSGMTTTDVPRYSPEYVFEYQEYQLKDYAMIARRLFSCLATWMTGKTLAQTVFSGYFCHQVDDIKDPVVSAMCKCVMEFVSRTIDIVTFSNVCFEEDLIRDMHGVIWARPSLSVIINQAHGQMLTFDLKHDSDDVYRSFLRAYFSFFKNILGVMSMVHRRELECKPLHKSLVALHSMMMQLDDAAKKLETENYESEGLPFGFELFAIKRLSTTTPFSVVDILPFGKAFELFGKIVDDLSFFSSLDTEKHFDGVFTVVDTLMHFASRRANILVRSILYTWFNQDSRIFGQFQPFVFILDSIYHNTGLQLQLTTKLSKDLNDALKHFKTYSFEILRETVHVLLLNLGRCHRKLWKLLATWDSYQAETESIDQFLATELGLTGEPFYLANWVYGIKLYLCEHALTLGFDLELYASRELPSIYGYLEFIHNNQTINRRRCRELRVGKIDSELSHFEIHDVLVTIKQELCRGLFRLYAGLKKDPFLTISKVHLKHGPNRYFHRFRRLYALGSPQALTYEQHCEISDSSNHDAVVLYANSAKCFESGKYMTNHLLKTQLAHSPPSPWIKDEIALMFKVCFANAIFLKVLSIKRQEYIDMHFQMDNDFKSHIRYPVISLKPK